MNGTVVVVGGGVIGAACAYELRLKGWTVTIIDAHRFGSGCSHANCGFVSPSHVLPLAAPSVLREGIFSLFHPDGPLRIAPKYNPELWSWLWQFARRCNSHHLLRAGRGIQPLLESSRKRFNEIMANAAIDCDWQTDGILFVFATPKALDHYRTTAKFLQSHFSLTGTFLSADDLLSFEPALRPGLAGGWYYSSDAHLRPDLLMQHMKRRLTEMNVRIIEHCPVVGFDVSRHTIKALQTSQSRISADTYVLATGAWTPRFSRYIGTRPPIQPGKGYSITLPRPLICPMRPLIFDEHRVAVTPFTNCYRIGSTMEFTGYDDSLNPRRLSYLLRSASQYLTAPIIDPPIERWYGWRPMTPDGVPIIDRSLTYKNLWIAAGHNMLGLSMAPATGQLIAELLSGIPPHLDPAPYRLKRFAT